MGYGQGTEHRRYNVASTTTITNADSPPMRSIAGSGISSNESCRGDEIIAVFHNQSHSRQGFWGTRTRRREASMTSSLSSWVTARRVAGADAHSPRKRPASGRASSSYQSLRDDIAVAAKAAQQVQSRQAK